MMSKYDGALTALITPMRDGMLDEEAFCDFVSFQINEGINGLVPMGTTGESATLSHQEHERVIEICIEVADGRVPVIAGAGSNSTAEAVRLAQFAQKAGADAILSVAPYYNKPNHEGVFQHFKTIAQAIDLDMILYNIPGRSVIDIPPDTVGRLVKACPNIVGIKDATGSVERITAQRLAAGADFCQLCGDDPVALGMIAHGARGVISVVSNVAPKAVVDLVALALKADMKGALALQDKLYPLAKALFLEPNPAGAKYAAAKLGLIHNELRLPLVNVSEATKVRIDAGMAHMGLV